MKEVIGVSFTEGKRIYYFDPANIKPNFGDDVIVETERGLQYGKIATLIVEKNEKSLNMPLKRIIRIATKDDRKKHELNLNEEKKAMKECEKLIKKYNLNMKVIEAFSSYDILDGNQNISREKLGKIVFSNLKLKTKLESILHPQIRKEILKFFEINKSQKIVFVAIPLLFEANMQDLFDKILFVYTNDEIRLERLIARNKYTKEYAQIRLNSQLSQDEKVKKSDYVIYNNSTKGELKEKVLKVLEQIR